ncbi:hypothetical protein IWQ60_002729 [Tieghemiomyces parasiticus]|uniref:Pentacotripeptide-repeat region of PRORP domain-containing protein n=1 Tax=Tieghemiomyces parasiticus TaxID=78921 RepID=A0A9W8AAT8_9FUNG|nr:hypothetical protein IWQ60_002729 [Tieghemiomyces parasiticus]
MARAVRSEILQAINAGYLPRPADRTFRLGTKPPALTTSLAHPWRRSHPPGRRRQRSPFSTVSGPLWSWGARALSVHAHRAPRPVRPAPVSGPLARALAIADHTAGLRLLQDLLEQDPPRRVAGHIPGVSQVSQLLRDLAGRHSWSSLATLDHLLRAHYNAIYPHLDLRPVISHLVRSNAPPREVVDRFAAWSPGMLAGSPAKRRHALVRTATDLLGHVLRIENHFGPESYRLMTALSRHLAGDPAKAAAERQILTGAMRQILRTWARGSKVSVPPTNLTAAGVTAIFNHCYLYCGDVDPLTLYVCTHAAISPSRYGEVYSAIMGDPLLLAVPSYEHADVVNQLCGYLLALYIDPYSVRSLEDLHPRPVLQNLLLRFVELLLEVHVREMEIPVTTRTSTSSPAEGRRTTAAHLAALTNWVAPRIGELISSPSTTATPHLTEIIPSLDQLAVWLEDRAPTWSADKLVGLIQVISALQPAVQTTTPVDTLLPNLTRLLIRTNAPLPGRYYTLATGACLRHDRVDTALTIHAILSTTDAADHLETEALGTLAAALARCGRLAEAGRFCRQVGRPPVVAAVVEHIIRPLISSTGQSRSPLDDSTTTASVITEPSEVTLEHLCTFLAVLYPQSAAPPGLALTKALLASRGHTNLLREGYTLAVGGLLRLSHYTAARALHSFLVHRGVLPDIKLVNALLKALVTHSTWVEAYVAYRDFVDARHRPNAYTGTILMNGLARQPGTTQSLGNTAAPAILDRYRRPHLRPPPAFLAPTERPAPLRYQSTPPDAADSETMPTPATTNGASYRAYRHRRPTNLPAPLEAIGHILADLRAGGVQLNTAFLTALLQCLIALGQPLDQVRTIFDDMRAGSNAATTTHAAPNAVTYLVMMWGYARAGAYRETAALLGDLRTHRPHLADISHYGVLMYAYSRAQQIPALLETWRTVRRLFPTPNARVVNVLLFALVRQGRPQMALDFFAQLGRQSLEETREGSEGAQRGASQSRGMPAARHGDEDAPGAIAQCLRATRPATTTASTTTAEYGRNTEHMTSLLIRAHLLEGQLGPAWQLFCRVPCADPVAQAHVLESFLRYFISQGDIVASEKLFAAISADPVKMVYWLDYLRLIVLASRHGNYEFVARLYASMRRAYLHYFPRVTAASSARVQPRWPRLWQQTTVGQTMDEGAELDSNPLLVDARPESVAPLVTGGHSGGSSDRTIAPKVSRMDHFHITEEQQLLIAEGCCRADRASLALLAYHDYLGIPSPVPPLLGVEQGLHAAELTLSAAPSGSLNPNVSTIE